MAAKRSKRTKTTSPTDPGPSAHAASGRRPPAAAASAKKLEKKAPKSISSASVDPHDHLTRVCAKLGPVILRVGRSPLAERSKESFDGDQAFKALVHVIVSQQLSGKAADTIFGRVEALGGGALPGPAELLAIPDEKLRAAGLSGAKTRGVKDLAARVLDGSLKLGSLNTHDDEAVIEALTKVRGIGRWSAEMFLMFRMGRPDVLSTGDLGLRKGMMHLFGLDDLPDPVTMERLSAHWRPFRSVACWYLWRVAEGTAPHRRKPESKEPVVAKKSSKKAAAKRQARKLPVSKQATSKQSVSKKAVSRQSVSKKAVARKAPSKQAVSKKPVARKAPSKQPASRAERVLSKR